MRFPTLVHLDVSKGSFIIFYKYMEFKQTDDERYLEFPAPHEAATTKTIQHIIETIPQS
jgi:hypothetical protein